MNTPDDSRYVEKLALKIFLFVLASWALLGLLSHLRYAPIAPLPLDAPENQFSARRAAKHFPVIVDQAKPRPAGSLANKQSRQRIVAQLESFGYDVEIQSGSGKVHPMVRQRSENDEVELHNIMTRIAGENHDEAIMLVAHYDSVPFGPGASDDAVGTAVVLEIARMFAQMPQPRHDIIFLITDGEELGLLGAKLFVEKHAWAKDVEVVINLEARGTKGPSLMFQTSAHSRWLVPLFAATSPKPISSSLFYEIYKKLPNDTDFTLFRNDGMQGFDFAFIGDVKNYHTDNDNLENVSFGSLQHHGQHAFELIRALDSLDFSSQPSGRVVYFDLFGFVLVWWPEKWSIWVTLIAILILGSLFISRKRAGDFHDERKLVIFRVLLKTVVVFAIGILTVIGIIALSDVDPRLKNLWPEFPVPYIVGLWATVIASFGFATSCVVRDRDDRIVTAIVVTCWSIQSVLLSIAVTGASHLCLVPVVFAVLIGLLTCRSNRCWLFMAAALPIAVGLMWVGLERLFYDAVGFRMPLLMAARTLIAASSLLPILAFMGSHSRFYISLGGSIVAVASFVIAIVQNPA